MSNPPTPTTPRPLTRDELDAVLPEPSELAQVNAVLRMRPGLPYGEAYNLIAATVSGSSWQEAPCLRWRR